MKKILVIFALFIATPCASQWRQDSALAYEVVMFSALDTNFFASLKNAIFRGGDSDALYMRESAGLWSERDEDHYLNTVGSMAATGPYIFAADGSVERSTDLGEHWQVVSWDTTNHPFGAGGYLTARAGSVYAGGYRSEDSGAKGTWALVAPGFNIFNALMWVSPATLIGGGSSGTWLSSDSGQHWTQTSKYISTSFAIADSTIFAAGSGVQSSTDFGKTWNAVTSLTFGFLANSIASDGKNLFVGTYDSGVAISTDLGQSWRGANEGIRNNGSRYWVGALGIFEDSILYANFSGSFGSPNYNDWFTCYRPISEMVDTTKSAVQQVPAGDSIEIYPNPALGTVTITKTGSHILGVNVLSILGTEVIDIPNVYGSSVTLDLSNEPSGTYFAQIHTLHGSILRKIVIHK